MKTTILAAFVYFFTLQSAMAEKTVLLSADVLAGCIPQYKTLETCEKIKSEYDKCLATFYKSAQFQTAVDEDTNDQNQIKIVISMSAIEDENFVPEFQQEVKCVSEQPQMMVSDLGQIKPLSDLKTVTSIHQPIFRQTSQSKGQVHLSQKTKAQVEAAWLFGE